MFEGIKNFVRKVYGKMIDAGKVEKKIGVNVAISNAMAEAINLWLKMYADEPPWLSNNITSMGLPASIAAEYARLVTLEFDSCITGCNYLNEQYQEFLKRLRPVCEYGCAAGGIVFKPYIDGGRIVVEAVQVDNFFPIAFNGRGQVTDGVFLEYKTSGDNVYIRMERHTIDDDIYRLTNKAYKSEVQDSSQIYDFGKEISLEEVDEWAELEPELEISNIEKCLFGYFRVPLANTLDADSPLGVSVYSREVGNIFEADKQWSRILWEYEGGELAVHASVDCFHKDAYGDWLLPEGKERLYRTFEHEIGRGGKAIDVFAPAIRDTSLFNGLNNILKRIEFGCGLAYGTLSDPQNVDKTAEEIKASKQRSYQTVSDIQKALQTALEDLLYAMVKLGQIEGLPVTDNYDVSFDWDDSIIVDKKEQLTSMQMDVSSGILRPELYIAKKYGVSEEEALKMMPKSRSKEELPIDEE